MRSKIIYYLNEEDVQTVAVEELGRNLSSEEIKKIKDTILPCLGYNNLLPKIFKK